MALTAADTIGAVTGSATVWGMSLLTVTDLRDRLESGLPDAVLHAWLETASAWIEKYAPGAPTSAKTEAQTRVCGYLNDQPMAALQAQAIGDLNMTYAATRVSPYVHSGAAAVLAPWRVHRAGVIE